VDTPVIRAVAWMLTPSTKADMTAFRFSVLSLFTLFIVHTINMGSRGIRLHPMFFVCTMWHGPETTGKADKTVPTETRGAARPEGKYG
jgi:hypothetical protein